LRSELIITAQPAQPQNKCVASLVRHRVVKPFTLRTSAVVAEISRSGLSWPVYAD
jgi:hypothetical protein